MRSDRRVSDHQGAETASTDASQKVALEVDSVSKSFGSINALEGVSLRITAGRVTALVGDNGAGKSTLVKILSGVLTPTSGTLRVEGNPVEFKEARAARTNGIHTVFQDLGLVGPLTIAENMFLCTEKRLRILGFPTPFLDREGMRLAARRALDNLGVSTV
jgi:ABC-type sugar transport system ATPase subunit